MGLFKQDLKARMVAYLLFITVIIVIALAAVAYFRSTGTLREAAFERLNVVADDRENKLIQFIDERQANILSISRIPAVRDTAGQLLLNEPHTPAYDAAYDTLQRLLESAQIGTPNIGTIIFLTNKEGDIFVSTNESLKGKDRAEFSYFVEGRKGSVVQNLYPSPETSAPTLTVATPLFNSQGKRLGVAAAHVDLSKVDQIMEARSGLGETGVAYLVNTSPDIPNLLVNSRGFGTEQFPDSVHSLGIDSAAAGERGALIYTNFAGQSVVGNYRSIPDRDLALLVEMDTSEALAPARRLGILIIGVGLGSVIFLAIGVYFATRQLLKPVLAVTEASVKIAAGDLTQTVPVLTRDEMGVLASNFNQMTSRLRTTLEDLEAEREKSESLLLNVLPKAIAERLKRGEENIADSCSEVSVLFADIVGFTILSTKLTPIQLIELLNRIFSAFDALSEKYGLEKIKTIGDAYMVVGGLPTPRDDHAEAIAEIALDMQEYVEEFNKETSQGLSIRIGINSGPVVAGVVGTKKFLYDIWGDAVNTAARMESQGIEGRIQVTEATYHHLRDKYTFEERGVVDIKGKGDMNVYILKGRANIVEASVSEAKTASDF